MMKTNLLLLAVLLVSITSCRTLRTSTNTTHTIDTTVVIKYVRDTVRVVEADTAKTAADIQVDKSQPLNVDSLLNCIDSLNSDLRYAMAALAAGKLTVKPVTAETSNAYAIAGLVDNKLILSLFQKPADFSWDNQIVETTIKDKTTTDTVHVVKEPWYTNVWLWLSVALLSTIVVLIITLVRLKT